MALCKWYWLGTKQVVRDSTLQVVLVLAEYQYQVVPNGHQVVHIRNSDGTLQVALAGWAPSGSGCVPVPSGTFWVPNKWYVTVLCKWYWYWLSTSTKW